MATLQECHAGDAGTEGLCDPAPSAVPTASECWGILQRSKTCWGYKPGGSWSPFKEAGTRTEEGPRVLLLPLSGAQGPGSLLWPPRARSGKLGHSSAPLTPHRALEKALALSPFMAWRSYRTVAAPVANGKQNCRELGTRPSPRHSQLWA